MGLLRKSIPGLAVGEKVHPSDILGGLANANGRIFWVKPSGDSDYAKFFEDHNVVEDGTNSVYNTIDAAVGACTANRGDIIFVDMGAYDETVTVDVAGITIVGLGGRGAAYIEPSTAGAEGMQVTADDVTLINLGVASDDTGDYALNLNACSRFRAYGCKFECASGASAVAVLMDGTASDQVADALLYDCEIAWAGHGIMFDDSAYGYPTQIRIQNCWFHNLITTGVGLQASGGVANLALVDCVFDAQEDGTETTDYIKVDRAGDTGIVTGCRFATATNDTAVLTIAAGIQWVANATEAGWSTARPA